MKVCRQKCMVERKGLFIILLKNLSVVGIKSPCFALPTVRQVLRWYSMNLGQPMSFHVSLLIRPAIRLNPVIDNTIPHLWMMEQVRQRADQFDMLVRKIAKNLEKNINIPSNSSTSTQSTTSP